MKYKRWKLLQLNFNFELIKVEFIKHAFIAKNKCDMSPYLW